ncbi:MAG: hypothetical protein IPJ61_21255 [Tessaracoccus sp.]|uniref:hypothetical protein n=1 Tax=Tessaracoccus sp. TaxID=1971211 RepID=UPI001EC2F4D8|nr:hypothetical protein [Tessaracoccus sp.]MBK7823517.1 hypothetical protein [Tessaracoccus sp.]
MSAEVSCGCGFTLGRLDAVHAVTPSIGSANDKVELICPLCGLELDVVLQKQGVLARATGPQVEYLRWGKAGVGGGRSVTIGRFRLEFPNLGVIEPHQICYPRVPAFQREDGAPVVPVLPVLHRYLDCVDVGQLDRLRDQGQLGHIEGDEYVARLPLLGGAGEPAEVRLPLFSYAGKTGAESVIRDVNLRVWPNLPTTTWRHYLVGLSATGPGATPMLGPDRRLRMFVRGASTGFTELTSVQRAGEALVGRLKERPTWVAIEVADAGKLDATVARAGGLFEVPAVEDKALGNNLNVGLDFGTSNTCVAFQIQGSKEIELVRPVAETDWSLYIVRAGIEPAVHRGPDLWPGRTGFGPSEDLYPSEILFRRTRGDQSQSLGDIANWTYGVDFGIPIAGIDPAFAETDHIISEFKWSAMLEGSVFHKPVALLQAQYIAATLMNAVVRFGIRQGAMPAEVYVRYSYPMAFGPGDHTVLEKAVEHLSEALPGATGMRWSILPGASESEAAAQSNDDRKAVEVFLDMGGGSTDIAIRTKEPESNDAWNNVYVTSVRYAGAALLAAYAGTRQSTCLAAGASVDQLRRKVRESTSASNVVKDSRLFNPNRERARVNRTDHFYGYVVELAARMLAAGVIEGRFARTAVVGVDDQDNEISIAIHLLGNGWRFKTTTTTADFKAALCAALESRTEALINGYLTGDHSYAKDRLAVLRTKTLIFTPGRSATNVPHDKAAVAVGVIGPKSRVGDKGQLSSGIVGWTTNVRTAGNKRSIPWFVRYDNNDSANKRNRPALGGAEGAAAAKGKLGAVPGQAVDGPATWYAEFDASPSFDWRDGPPALPRDLTPVKELDPDLVDSLGKLRIGCADLKPTWFKKGAFEVLLEELFRDALREKIEG